MNSCEVNPLFEKQIQIRLVSTHPWEEASLKKLWHTLVWTDGWGRLQAMHLSPGERQATIPVQKGKSTIICAYPLGDMLPFGGFFSQGNQEVIHLSQEKGELAKLLLDAYLCNPEAVECIDADALFNLCPRVSLLNKVTLTVGLLNGVVEIEDLSPLLAKFADLPAGFWVPERKSQVPFFSVWGESVSLCLEGGVQRWWCRERSLELIVFADLKKKTFSYFLAAATFW